MKLIKKKELFPTICISYTIISLSITLLEVIKHNEFSNDQFNLISMFVWTSIAVFVLSQHYRFEKFSALTMILVQYLIEMFLIITTIYISGFFVSINPNGYKDVFRSFTIPYVIGAGIYYISLYRFVKKANNSLKFIKEHSMKI